MQIVYLKNILSFKIAIVLSLTRRYTLNEAYNINHRLYKSLENNIL